MVYRINDSCPRCHKPTALVTIEPHPSRRDLLFYNFECGWCGPIKTKLVKVEPEVKPQTTG